MEIDHDEFLFFRKWIKGNRSEPEFVSLLRDAKHWTRGAKANEFYNRNKEVLSKYHVKKFRVVHEVKFCKDCGVKIDPQAARIDKEFCNDACRNKFYRSLT
jgi:hypothetical protein